MEALGCVDANYNFKIAGDYKVLREIFIYFNTEKNNPCV